MRIWSIYSFVLVLLLLTACGEFDPSNRGSVGADSATKSQLQQHYRLGEILIGLQNDGPAKASLSQILPGSIETGSIVFTPTAAHKAELPADEAAATTILKLQLPADLSVAEALEQLAQRTDILFAEPNYLVHRATIPNDPYFAQQWGLENTGQTLSGDKGTLAGISGADMGATQAWDLATGSSAIVVATLDSGIDLSHPDLADNIWNNPGETGWDSQGQPKESNRLDDDGNGYIDDVHGWNFVMSNNSPLDDDVDGHGSHVAGIIGALGNNGIGIAGINWQVQMLPVKFLDRFGSGDLFKVAAAYNYAVKNGARVINASYTYPQSCTSVGPSSTERTALSIARNQGVLIVAAAGNFRCNNDIYAFYPGGHDLDNILAVAASDPQDNLASTFSNYGVRSVDLAAPGVNIYSTVRQSITGMDGHPGYNYMSGTSMATPQVTGAAALLWSLHPELTYGEVRDAILFSVDPQPGLQGKVATGGRLNLAKALGIDFSPGAPTAPTDLAIDDPAPLAVKLSWRDLSNDETGFIIERSDNGGAYSQLGQVLANETQFIDQNAPDLTEVRYRVKAVIGISSSAYSLPVSFYIPLRPPTGLGISFSSNQELKLFWQDNSQREAGYGLERRTTEDSTFTPLANLPENTSWYTDSDLVPGATYIYRVKALHDQGDSDYSPEFIYAAAETDNSAAGAGCFIATAAWGTPFAQEIDSLRRFRDEILLNVPWGRAFVTAYYRYSPPVADIISHHDWLRAFVRFCLQPLVWFAEIATPAETMEWFAPPLQSEQGIIIGFKPGTSDQQIERILTTHQLAQISRQAIDQQALVLIKMPPNLSFAELQKILKNYPEVDFAEINQLIHQTSTKL